MLKVNNKIDISVTVLGIITIITVLMLKSKNNLEFLKTNEEVLAYIGSVMDSTNMTVTNLNVTTDLKVDGKINMLPRGIIVAWNGKQDTVPLGWVLCNGANNTPDLRSRFIVGSGGVSGLTDYGWGNTGGLEYVALTVGQIPSHSHNQSITMHALCYKDGGCASQYGLGNYDNKRTSTTMDIGTAVGGNQAHENRPPYYALAWIMKS